MRLTALAVSGMVLAACAAPAPVVTVTVTPSPSESPTASAQPSEPAAEGPASWIIDYAGVGPFNVGDTAAEIAAITEQDYSADLEVFEGYCANFALAPSGELSHIAALAESGGADGPVDAYFVYDWEGTGAALPRTHEGITVGSAWTEVELAYGDALQTEEYLYDPAWTRAWVEDGESGMLFLIDDSGAVVSIAAGRQPQYRYIEGCA